MAKLQPCETGNFGRIAQKNIRKTPDQIDEIFDEVYKSFKEQITKTIRIPRSKKIQLINEREIIACTEREIYHINTGAKDTSGKNRKEKQIEKALSFDTDILSIALTSDKAYILVLVDNRTIQVLSCPSLLIQREPILLDIAINSLASHAQNFIIGESSGLIVKWKWTDMTLNEVYRRNIAGYKCVHRLEYYVAYSDHTCMAIDYENRVLFRCDNFPLTIKIASISHRGEYFALFMSDGQTGIIETFEINQVYHSTGLDSEKTK